MKRRQFYTCLTIAILAASLLMLGGCSSVEVQHDVGVAVSLRIATSDHPAQTAQRIYDNADRVNKAVLNGADLTDLNKLLDQLILDRYSGDELVKAQAIVAALKAEVRFRTGVDPSLPIPVEKTDAVRKAISDIAVSVMQATGVKPGGT